MSSTRQMVAIAIGGLTAFTVPLYLANTFYTPSAAAASHSTRRSHNAQLSSHNNNNNNTSPDAASNAQHHNPYIDPNDPDAPIIPPHHLTAQQIIDTYDKNAISYQKKLNLEETLTGVATKRYKLLSQHAYGNVLEIAAGGGRNSSFWDWDKVQFLTMGDISKEMLKVAQQRFKYLDAEAFMKWRKKMCHKAGVPLEEAKEKGLYTLDEFMAQKYRFVQLDAQDLQYADNSFDTVVDTFGLCSMEDPAKALREMFRVTKPGGKILLLEHGRSHKHPWINGALDKRAEVRARKEGCMWNRDVPLLVRQTLGRSVDVQDVRFAHFGTLYALVLQKSGEEIEGKELYERKRMGAADATETSSSSEVV